MIYYNLNTINDWNFGDDNIIKVYRNNAVCYYKVNYSGDTPTFDVCYAVVDDISQYQETEFEDVYDKATEKWYKLNNLNQYEEYGVYGSGRSVTTYDGKLTVDDGYEYEWNGSSWVNVGEVSGSTASLPNVPFSVNFNAKNYDSNSKTLLKTSGQLVDVDAVITAGTPTVSDGYLTIASGTRATISGYQTYFNRDNNNPNLTIISKQNTNGNNGHMFANRDSNYNWMYRCYSNKLTLHGSSETGQIAVTTQPVIESVRINSNRQYQYNNYTDNTTSSGSSFNYGGTNSGKFALFQGYATSTGENFVGDFYWVYMSQNTLTDEQVQQVIDYNEDGGSQPIYPIYYDEKADPLNDLTFNTMEDAVSYAQNNCVYDGMKATIGTDRYYFDSEDENGWVKILEYYKVEDVTPGGASGWTISGSSTYNPDSSYYDDFDLETSWSNNTYKIAKVTIYGYDHFTYYLRSYHQYSTSYGYAMATNVDEVSTLPSTMPYYSASAITNTYNFNKSPKSAVNLSNYRRVTYNNLDKTVEHTFYVYFYGRNNSSYLGNATILIPKEQTNENWEQVTFSASSNVASAQKNLYIDNNYTTSGGTQFWYYRWMIGLPSGSHTSYSNYSNYDYCQNVTSSTFTSVTGEQRQVNYTWDNTTNKALQFRLVDSSGNTLSFSNTVVYIINRYNSCNIMSSTSISTTSPTFNVPLKEGGHFTLNTTEQKECVYGYASPAMGTTYYVDNYSTTFDIVYTALTREAVSVTYTTYDPNDSETPTFSTDITYPYSGGTTVTTAGTSYDVPYTYSYTVEQTSNMFYTSGNQTYTAGQAARTINFVLYPNNREFASVADLEAYGYPWEGMIAYVGTDKYVYQNGEWVYNPSRLPAGYTEVKYIQSTNRISNTQSTTRFNVQGDNTSGNTYTLVYELPSDAYATSYYGWLFGNNAVCYQKLDNGWGAQKVSPKYFGREGGQSASSAVGTKVELVMSKDNFKITDVQAGTTQTVNYPSTRSYTSSNRFGIFCLYDKNDTYCAVGKIYELKIEDVNGTLLNDYIPAVRDSDSKPGVYDIVGDAFYFDESGTLTIVAGDPV